MKKKHIAVILNTVPESGGVFQYAMAMVDALAALDSNRFVVRVFTRNKRWRAIAREHCLAVAILPKFGHGEIRRWFTRLPKFLGRDFFLKRWNRLNPFRLSMEWYSIDAVIFPDLYSPLELPAKVKRIACIHDLMHRYESRFPEVGNPDEYAARERIYAMMVEHCSAILVDSETGKQHVVESYQADPATVFPLPYVMCDGLKKAVPIRPVSLPEGIEGNFLYYPAQFWLHKNHQKLLEAVASLRDECVVQCVFSGDTRKNGYELFLQTVERLGLGQQVHCLGYVSEGEMSWLYQHARCMIMPTFFGPTNIPPLEAMHFGCPVGISDIYGMPEQLGDAAMYFDPDSVNNIAQVIRELWTNDDLRAMSVTKGFAVAKAHSSKNFSARLDKIIQTVLSSYTP